MLTLKETNEGDLFPCCLGVVVEMERRRSEEAVPPHFVNPCVVPVKEYE